MIQESPVGGTNLWHYNLCAVFAAGVVSEGWPAVAQAPTKKI